MKALRLLLMMLSRNYEQGWANSNHMDHVSHEVQVIFNLTIAVATALVGGLLAHRLKQAPIVGYLLAGICIGPFASNFIGDREQIAALAEIGVIFLMFALGIEFSLKELNRIKGAAVVGTLLQVMLIMAGGFGLGTLLGWRWEQSLFFGGIISVSSTMVILKTLLNRGEVNSNHGRLLLSMLIVQDLAVVILILLLPKVAVYSNSALVGLLMVVAKAVAFIAATLYMGERVVPRIMAHVERQSSSELFILTAVVLALGTASVSAWLGLSPALGAFMGGLMLTETDFDHRVVAEIVPMRDIFSTLFFVSVGMLIDTSFILRNLPAVIGLALFIMAVKALMTMVALAPFRMGGKSTAFAALGMISIGEFNYVLAQVGRQSNAISTELYNLILTSSLITIVLSPAAFWIAPRTDKALAHLKLWQRLSPVSPIPVPDVPEGHAIVVGYGRVGKRIVRGLRQAGMPVTVIEQDLNLVREITAAGQRAIYGDASYASVLASAHPEKARIFVVTLPDFGATRAAVHRARQANSEALIIARAQRAEDDVKLRDAGATSVAVPEIAGALMLLEEALLLLGLRHEHVFTGLAPLSMLQPGMEMPEREATSITPLDSVPSPTSDSPADTAAPDDSPTGAVAA
jgi:CPA2 family monovalent cation:H+ antiporter-2